MTTSIKFRALTDEDHKLFFEALGEHGKDFQNIQQYMSQKGGQKTTNSNNSNCSNNNTNSSSGSSNNNNNINSSNSNNNGSSNNNGNANRSSESSKLIDPQEKRELDKKEDDRKREQIRNFYNKLYAKLSELIGKIDDRVEKVNQELYLLINYGEIWKRHGFKFNTKTKRLLEELVYQGTTTFRFEKKNVRLRTPTCKALKKINKIGIDEEVKVVTTRELPKEVIVEFHPASNRDWLKVQAISQNPRVRAKLSIQKRLTSILDYLENKWNLSPDKLNKTVDVWLKTTSSGHQSSETTDVCTTNTHQQVSQAISVNNNNNNTENHIEIPQSLPVIYDRLRIRPSSHHELNEVNVTRVVPDNHLDLSLNAFIKRLNANQPKIEPCPKEQSVRDSDCMESHQPQFIQQQHEAHIASENSCEFSSGLSNKSRLPISLTTPDCSMFFERSCTSDQPGTTIDQARKHLSRLQSLTGGLEGFENSRTAYEDTQDRSLMNQNSRSVHFAPNISDHEPIQAMQTNPMIIVNNDIPALYDEDAALPASSSARSTSENLVGPMMNISTSVINHNNNSNSNNHISLNHLNPESHNSKSGDFQIPKNGTLIDYFKKINESKQRDKDVLLGSTGDEAECDTFPVDSEEKLDEEACDAKDLDRESEEQYIGLQHKETIHGSATSGQAKLQNHMIEIKKFAEGWTKLDEPSITLGELYLAFKCPEKIILEYEFEPPEATLQQNSNQQNESSQNQTVNNEHIKHISSANSLDSSLMLKLLTAANLSLAQIERRKQEQEHKLHESQQSNSKFKKRKGSGQCHTMTTHDIEATNQRVEEALKQLQPVRLSSFKRSR